MSDGVATSREVLPALGFGPFIRRNLVLAAIWLVIVNAFALMALNRLNLAPDTAMEWMHPEIYKPQQSWNIVHLHNRWDAYWYLDIAKNGYYLRGERGLANVVFFPLYPLLIRAVGLLTAGNLELAGWVVSSVFLALALIVLTQLAREFHPQIEPLLPSVFLLVYPTAFFLNAIYSESLFMFLSLSMVLCARRHRFAWAGLWAALATATRVAGVFLLIILLIEFVKAHGARALFTRRAWPLAVAPLGILAFFGYHWFAFGDFLLYLKAQRLFGRNFETELADFTVRNSPDLVNTILDLSYTVLAVFTGVYALLRLRLSYGAYMLISLGVALASGTVLGIARYAMVLFPIYLIGAGLRSAVGRGAWLFASALMLALNIVRFVNHYWAG
jgi:hypothetical protein